MQRDINHENARKALVKLDSIELRRRIAISSYKKPDYVASEVLASFVRSRFGQESGVLDSAGATLYGRVMTLVDRYLQKNPQWGRVVSSSNETLKDACASVWVALVTDRAAVSCSEVRLLTFVEARVIDFMRSQLASKNQMVSLETMNEKDEYGNETSWENIVEADEEDEPVAVLERKRLSHKLNEVLVTMSPLERRAVQFRLVFNYDWEQVAKLLECSIPTARKHYSLGIERLKGELQ